MSAVFLAVFQYADILKIISLWVDETKISLDTGASKGHWVKSSDAYTK